MNWDAYVRMILMLILVLGLLGATAWIVRRFGLAGAVAMPRGPRERRLGIVEVMALDAKRRLVIVRRDDVEHLVLLGAGSETVIERAIAPPAFRLPERTP